MSAFDAYIRLDGLSGSTVLTDENMSKHTTYRIGGPAKLYIECDSVSGLALTLDVLAEEDVEWAVVGRGSNLLVADEGYDGAIVVLGGEFCGYDLKGFGKKEAERPQLEPGSEVCISVGAGNVLSRLVQKAYGCGLSGLEFAVGIPGTVGGALFMNAGSREEWIGSIVDTVTSYKPGEGLKIRHGSEISWGYRKSNLPADEVIVECTLRMHVADKAAIGAQMEKSLKRRKMRQPLDFASCGSVFRNPEGRFAGELIQKCGLKGATCGGAKISERHANFIVNTGSATAMDVLTLIHLARNRVEETHGIRLRPEVRFLGFAQ